MGIDSEVELSQEHLRQLWCFLGILPKAFRKNDLELDPKKAEELRTDMMLATMHSSSRSEKKRKKYEKKSESHSKRVE